MVQEPVARTNAFTSKSGWGAIKQKFYPSLEGVSPTLSDETKNISQQNLLAFCAYSKPQKKLTVLSQNFFIAFDSTGTWPGNFASVVKATIKTFTYNIKNLTSFDICVSLIIIIKKKDPNEINNTLPATYYVIIIIHQTSI